MPADGKSDEVLVLEAQRAMEGDTRAFAELVRRHQPHILTNCASISGSEADASDLTQEVFVKAYFALRRFRGEAGFGTWLQRIKINHCLSHIRRRRHTSVSIDEADPRDPALRDDVNADVRAAQIVTDDRVWRALKGLPGSLRVPLILADMDRVPYSEIAQLLGVSLSGVKMRVRRARTEFRKRYDDSAR